MQFEYDSKYLVKKQNTFSSIKRPATIFIGKWIDSTINQTIKCTIQPHENMYRDLRFGIVSSVGNQNLRRYIETAKNSYVYRSCGDGEIYIDGEFTGRTGADGKRVDRLEEEGQILTLILNLSSNTLSYDIDGEQTGIIAKNISKSSNIKYKFAITMYEGDVVTFLSVDGHNNNEQNDDNKEIEKRQVFNDVIKCNECHMRKEKISIMKAEKNSLEILVNELSREMELLKQQNNKLNDEYKESKMEHIPLLRNIKSAICDKLQSVNQFDLATLQEKPVDDLLNLQQNIDDSQNEFKQIEQSLDELKEKLLSVKDATTKAISPDVSNYTDWKPKDIVRYVCLLENGKFRGISDVLLKSFTEQGIGGADLVGIEKNDLFTMGIKNFKDRNAIYNHFQALKYKTKEGNDNDTQMID